MSKKHVIFLITLFFIGIAGLTYYFNGSSGEELIDCDTNIAKESDESSDILSGESSIDDLDNRDDSDSNSNSNKDTSSAKNTKSSNSTENEEDSKDKTSSKEGIWVHVCGEVREPGVYELKSKEARVVDAIKAADGLTKKASLWAVNQAELVVDGQQVYIPSKDEVSKDVISSTSNDDSSNSTTSNNSKVNINTASTKELITLPGIGEAKAQKIIDYRADNGKFSKIEDIMNIPGIKEGLFNKISENITV